MPTQTLYGQELQTQITATLTPAQITTMFTTPVSLIPAPGAGKAIIVDAILIDFAATGTAYTGGGNISFPYHGGSNSLGSTVLAAASVLTNNTAVNQLMQPIPAAGGQAVPANTGVDITNATGVFVTGTNNPVKIKIWYSVVTL